MIVERDIQDVSVDSLVSPLCRCPAVIFSSARRISGLTLTQSQRVSHLAQKGTGISKGLVPPK